jgi:hypothetical protein
LWKFLAASTVVVGEKGVEDDKIRPSVECGVLATKIILPEEMDTVSFGQDGGRKPGTGGT